MQDIKKLFLQDLQQLSKLSIEQITKKLLDYIENDDRENATEVIQFVKEKYYSTDDIDLMRKIIIGRRKFTC